MTGDAKHKADEKHLTQFGIKELQRHLRNRLRSGHSQYGNYISDMPKTELVKLHYELHGVTPPKE